MFRLRISTLAWWASLATLIATLGLSGAAVAQNRHAFIVGTNQYDNLDKTRQLQRAVNDARSVAAAFKAIGFNVVSLENLPRGQFNSEWQRFLEKLQPGDTAVVYYAGHGVEIEGLNFLLPRDIPDIKYGRQELIKRESISVADLLLDLRDRKPEITLIVLDACRDNPLIPEELRSAGARGGLAPLKGDPPRGTFIMYSAGAGQSALDRLPGNDPDPVNSIFTRKLVPLLGQRGLPIHDLARQLRADVVALAASAQHMQVPAYYDNVLGRYCLAGCDAEVVATDGPTGGPKTATQAPYRPDAATGTGAGTMNPGTAFRDCPECPEMVVVPAGEFMMGSPDNEVGRDGREGPRHKVTIARPLGVGKFEVTFAEWDACAAAGACKHQPGDEGWGRGRRPVINVSWHDAKGYAAWLSRKTGKTYRLLSEAEWEYAARAGTTTAYSFGDTLRKSQAQFSEGVHGSAGGTTEVGSFPANRFGLHDMHGNVWEWAEDNYHSNYNGAPTDGSVWPGGDLSTRVLRGGSWNYHQLDVPRSANRIGYEPHVRNNYFGFRLSRTL